MRNFGNGLEESTVPEPGITVITDDEEELVQTVSGKIRIVFLWKWSLKQGAE